MALWQQGDQDVGMFLLPQHAQRQKDLVQVSL